MIILIPLIIFWRIVFDWVRNNNFNHSHRSERREGGIILIGGNMQNKGAQAMVFTAIDRIRERYPGIKIYMFSTGDFDVVSQHKQGWPYNDVILWPWEMSIRLNLAMPSFSGAHHVVYKGQKVRLHNVLLHARAIFDISGYALSSQWGFIRSINYLLSIIVAKKYGTPYYILPQSIGPFDYNPVMKILLIPLLYIYLGYARLIFFREHTDEISVSRFNMRSKHAYDMVLTSRTWNKENIYRVTPKKNIPVVSSSRLCGIIPNARVFAYAHWGEEDLQGLYQKIITTLLMRGYRVVIIQHSFDDAIICEKILAPFLGNIRVDLIKGDLSPLDMDRVISHLNCVVVSRYHALVHAYRNSVPAFVIGWAQKYRELMNEFRQEQYHIDCRENLDIEKIQGQIDIFLNCLGEEHQIIRRRLGEVNAGEDIFQKIFLDLENKA